MGIGTGLGVAGLASAGIGAGASISAANTQASAAKNAQELQAQEAQNALNFQEQQWNTTQQEAQPFLKAGTGAVNELGALTSTPGQGLLTPWTQQFQAPTAQQAAETPGYQFQLQQGLAALQNSAAAQGNLTSGATGTALQQYGQGLASTDYQQAYQNALTQYQTAYNTFEQNQANQYNRLAGLAGTGQTTAAQLGSLGQSAASNVGNISLTSGAQQGQDIQNAAAANASGYVGAANAASGALSGLGTLGLLSQLLGGGGVSGVPASESDVGAFQYGYNPNG
jgi:hypothetical protein